MTNNSSSYSRSVNIKHVADRLVRVVQSARSHFIFQFGSIWLSAFLVLMSFFLNSLLKNKMYLDVFPREIVFPAALYAATALVVTVAVYWLPWLKTHPVKLFAGVIFALLLINYDNNLVGATGVIRGFIPALSDNDSMALVSIVYLVALLALSVLLSRSLANLLHRIKKIPETDVELGVYILISYLFVVPAFKIVQKIPTMLEQGAVEAAAFKKEPGQTSSDKPDIYYIVLDRYTNNEVLKDQFSYDNSAFTNQLKSSGFTINENAASNYPYTNMSVASTINAMYTNELVAPYKDSDFQSSTLYFNSIWHSTVARALKQEGYQMFGLGNWYGSSYKMPLADLDYTWQHKLTIFGAAKRLRGIESNAFTQSIFYRFAVLPEISWWPAIYERKEHVAEVSEQLRIMNELATSETQGGRFVFAHLLVPHDPYIFNVDGSLATDIANDNFGEPIKQKYIRQVEFINDQLSKIVQAATKNSNGKAVFIINADEGPFPWVLNTTSLTPSIHPPEDMRTWPNDWLAMKFGILQAVRIPKATESDLRNLNSANIFRIILNRYAGYSLEYLPNCQYGIIDSNSERFVYANISNKFTEASDPSCSLYESLPTTR